MAFKEIIKFGKHEFEGIVTLRKLQFGGIQSPVVLEKHVFPDIETYNQIKEEQRGFKLNEDGTPMMTKNKKGEDVRVGVPITLKYNEVVQVSLLNSRDLGEEQDLAFREELQALCYKYFGDGKEKV